MKLKGFGGTLNTGSLELSLVPPQSVSSLTCYTCGFTSPAMYLGWCKHVYCSSCLFALEDLTTDETVLNSYCVLCEMDVFSMKLTVHESFIRGLHCFCPRCSINLKLSELRNHLACCMPSAASDCRVLATESDQERPTSASSFLGDDFSVVPEESAIAGELCEIPALEPDCMRIMISSTRAELRSCISEMEERIGLLAIDSDAQDRCIRNLRQQTRKPEVVRVHLKCSKEDPKLFTSVPVAIANLITTFAAFRKNDNTPGSTPLQMYIEAVTDGPDRARFSVRVPGRPPSVPLDLDRIQRSANGDIKLGAAYTFPNVFTENFTRGVEVELRIEYLE